MSKWDCRLWLNTHIPSVIGNIDVSIDDNRIEYNPSGYDKYMVNLSVKYDGQPVSALDLSYFNGEKEVSPVHCKNGEATLLFPDLQTMDHLDIKVIYNYKSEAKIYDPELGATYNNGGYAKYDTNSHVRIPVKVKSNKISQVKEKEAVPTPDPISPELAQAAMPVGEPMKKTIERNFDDEAKDYIKILQDVEKAVRSKDYASVKSLFTEQGFALFSRMMSSAEISVTKSKHEYTCEKTGRFIIGRTIPVAVKNGKHISNENIVLRFDPEQKLVSSVAYALTRRAETDIFREAATWTAESRHSLLQFMEDYQTAFALKRLDYIESIFSDNAIIIVGKVNGKKGVKRYFDGIGKSVASNVTYKKYDKETYLKNLRRDFQNKKFIQLVFEDTEISKVNTNDFLDNEVLWIELKQQYTSSDYSDKGYLALQINMKSDGSMINVRSWTPYHIPINDLKRAFPIGN